MLVMQPENEVLLAVTMFLVFVVAPAVSLWKIYNMRVKGRPWSSKKKQR